MGCFIDDTVTVTSPERLDTSLFTYEYCFGDPRMTMYAPPGYTSYTWIGPGPDTLAVNTPDNYILLTNPQLGQEYVCIFVSPPACPIYDSTLLTFRPPAYYFHPDSTINIFTPNGDMKNDIFYPYFDHSVYVQTPQNAQPPYDFFDLHISYFEIWVYDRWGKEVFYSNDYTIGWDGSIDKGKNCSDGVYYWVSKMISNCSADQTPVVNEGFVHLIR